MFATTTVMYLHFNFIYDWHMTQRLWGKTLVQGQGDKNKSVSCNHPNLNLNLEWLQKTQVLFVVTTRVSELPSAMVFEKWSHHTWNFYWTLQKISAFHRAVWLHVKCANLEKISKNWLIVKLQLKVIACATSNFH